MRLRDATVAAAPVLFVLLWSTGFVGAKYGLPYAGPMTFLSTRMAMAGVALVLHDHAIAGAASLLGWAASFLSLIGITLGTLYQKRFGGDIDWRTGNLVQYVTAGMLFTFAAFAFETSGIQWTGEFIFAAVYLAVVLSIGAVALMYWLIRRSAATGFSSLFYLVPAVTALFAFVLFGERLDLLSVAGILVCALGVVVVSRGASANAATRETPKS